MLLFIDNYDSFTYNIVQYFAELGQEVLVRCNDEITIEEIEALKPQYLVIGPGPCSPKEAGISVAAMQHFAGRLPVMGVCLGHQTMGEAFGGNVVRAQTMMHGKVSPVFHHGTGMFKDLPNPVNCTRYHSLAIDRATLPDCLEITAWTEDGEIMGVCHKEYAVEGVQFHPEALLTEHGHDMLKNFSGEVEQLRAEGCKDIILDPGFGFGKTAEDNFKLLKELDKLQALELPLLVGVSRKRMIHQTLGVTVDEALNGTTVINTAALLKGASILRVHDVKEAVQAVKLVEAIRKG